MNGEEHRPTRLLVQDAARLEDVELKHDRVRNLLKATGAHAVLLQDPANIAWFTAGGDMSRCSTEECANSVFVTPDARLFATNSVDSAQIFEREAFALGFQLKQREWFQPHSELVADLCRGRKVISDRNAGGTKSARRAIRALRLPLTNLETDRLKTLSKVAVHAVEATGHHLKVNATESEVAAEVSHRLLKRTVAAARIQVCADGRNERYRHWTFGDQPIKNYAVISCVARRWGLHVGVTRTICLHSVPQNLLAAFQKATLVHATGLFFSRHGEALADVWKKIHRIYEKFEMAGEWQKADQASVIGYSPSEVQLTPDSDHQLEAPVPMFWHPSVGPALVGDTVLCLPSANEQLTQSSTWPRISVKVKGREVICPGILLIPERGTVSADHAAIESDASAVYDLPEHPAEDSPSPVDSVWEMSVPSDDAVWQDDESAWSRESVFD
ncbi:Metallopeptidase family M24 [Fuerstiella marisgermanici]|uniref:Metallopeptidase family M24 n=2 Tax=Fuerstiella marisgermanici TaxID=1891926 RepID=A0A1P8WFK2_9PLAN|nr:Metallopeptidase family M24 [Fuerstiella marisgermanici]